MSSIGIKSHKRRLCASEIKIPVLSPRGSSAHKCRGYFSADRRDDEATGSETDGAQARPGQIREVKFILKIKILFKYLISGLSDPTGYFCSHRNRC